jgi:hypothetical protein
MPYFPRPADGSRYLVWKTMLHIKETNFTRGSHITTLKCSRPGQTREENSVLKLSQLLTICSPMYCWYQAPFTLSNLLDWVDSPGTTSETKLLPHAVLCIVDSKWCTFPPTGHTEWTTLQSHQHQTVTTGQLYVTNSRYQEVYIPTKWSNWMDDPAATSEGRLLSYVVLRTVAIK